MAEALLTVMLKNLNSLIQKGFGLLWSVNKEMEKLSSILSTIRAVLEDAEEKQLRNRAIKNWLQKLKDVSGELDDILDECSAEASLLEYKMQRFGVSPKVKASFLSCLNPKNTRFRFQIAKKMEDVSERLDDIAKEREKFHLREVVEDPKHVQDECTVTKSDLPDVFSTFYNGKSLRTLQLTRISGCMGDGLPHRLYFPTLRAFDIRNDRNLSLEFKLNSISSLINFGCCRSLNHTPSNIGKLSCLRSLSRFIVDRRRGCYIDELGSLLKLGGSLRIEHLEKVKSPLEAKKANLVGKTNLQRLHLHWYYNQNEIVDQKLNEQVLDALEPPLTLKLMEISNFRGGHLPHWFNANFENLVSICFNGCRNSLELPTAMGKLPSLASLYLRSMDCLRYVDNESYNGQLIGGFFRLETLVIDCLPNLERLSREERSDIFPRVSYLSIAGCPKLISLPSLPSIEELRTGRCDKLTSLPSLPSIE
ncbi:hypothetical protein FEM48_Zijuj11G0144600 [Ziziphus jujuba var. spinosa]|uniref:Rx N-terminal domain-containing protein n=1 Tax=Ziziphus jujuba var. spinosa TaxID=714518 RepID=A0A978UJG9_ZIZJJ|nr:hypothetical protein FEM48_Zijuj11G0144600 [Ziziphus jujuba var. spinosa]